MTSLFLFRMGAGKAHGRSRSFFRGIWRISMGWRAGALRWFLPSGRRQGSRRPFDRGQAHLFSASARIMLSGSVWTVMASEQERIGSRENPNS
jgi:hypothetical protein